MIIRKAQSMDIPDINRLLFQVAKIHRNGRPDIFKPETKKYTDIELEQIINDPQTPIFVAVNEDEHVCGYAFCIHNEIKNHLLLCDKKSLYIDDLCVDENCRGMGIGYILYEYVKQYAEKTNCDQITLNVWCFNESAMKFYQKCGLSPLKTVMEYRIK